MVTINEIPYNKIYKLKVRIPRAADKKLGYGAMAILNNRSIEDSLKFFENPQIMSIDSKYFYFYIDRIYREKIHTKIYRMNHKDYQTEKYEFIQKKFPTFKTPINIKMIHDKNFFFDMSVYNDLFFKSINTLALRRRIELYFNLLNKIYNRPDLSEEHPNKIIYMDAKSWIKNKKDLNNPIMYIFIAYKKFPELLKLLGEMDIIIYSDKGLIKINPATLNEKEFSKFKTEFDKVLSGIVSLDDNIIDKEVKDDEVKTTVVKQIGPSSDKEPVNTKKEENKEDDTVDIEPINYDETPDDINIDISEPIKQKEEDITDDEETDIFEPDNDYGEEFNVKLNEKIADELEKMEDDPDLNSEEVAKRIRERLDTDKELVSLMHNTMQEKKTGKSTASLKRDEELRKKQRDVKIQNKKLSDYTSSVKDDPKIELPEIDISTKVVTTNENVKNIRFNNFEKTYNKEMMLSDTIKIFENLNEKSIPAYVVSFDIKDSSDELNYKDTYHVVLEDENRVRHSLTFDVPKFVDDKFLYINGNKKIITKQLVMKPISKTAPDTVQICSNYNKIFIYRYGPKLSPKLEKFKKAATMPVTGIIINNGDARNINVRYKTTLEYDFLAESIISIKLKDCELLFNQQEIETRLEGKKLKDNDFCIGFYKDKTPIIMDFKTEKIDGKYDIIDFILHHAPDKFVNNYNELKSGTSRYTYTRAKIMSKFVPILLLVGYCEGITEVLKKANIKHYFSDKKPVVDDNEAVVKFADGYLVYDRYPYENSLLLNAFSIIPTSSFNYSELDSKEIYLELFYEMFKARNLANAFDSFYEFMIDPITKEVLEDLDYPTDFVSVILTGNALLVDNSYIPENDMNLYRVRSNEIVNGIIHRNIADAYAAYRASSSNTTPVKISIPKDAIIKELLAVNTVEEFSTLNPIYETEKVRAITPRGYKGMNTERAFTIDKRSYDKSMMGILGISTSPDANVGVVRKLSVEPNVVGPRGYINIEEDYSKIKDVNLFTSAELLTPMSATHDDSNRTAMASKQSGHIIPVAKSSPVLVSNGMEQTIQYNLSKDFVIIAEDDGEVVEVDEKTGLVVVQYKNGSSQAVDTKPRVVKNASSGFYISNKLDCDLKLGDKVKKNDIIGYEDKFFTNDGHNKNRFNIGSLQKIAIMSSYSTFEDSTFVTKKMSEEMASDIVMMTDVIIGKNSNIGKMVKVGDSVNSGDILIEYDTSFEDSGINKFLDSISDELHDEVKSLSRTPIKSKYSGVIEDIKIYTTIDTEDMSPSLQKIMKEYYGNINRKKKILNKYDKSEGIVKAGLLITEAGDKLKPSSDGKIKGKEVFDGILIEFYIKYFDPMSVGDKITFYSALKSIIGEVIEEGYEPYSEFRPDEEISTFLGPSAVLARMVPSAMLVMFTNKILIELKRSLQDIYEN